MWGFYLGTSLGFSFLTDSFFDGYPWYLGMLAMVLFNVMVYYVTVMHGEGSIAKVKREQWVYHNHFFIDGESEEVNEHGR